MKLSIITGISLLMVAGLLCLLPFKAVDVEFCIETANERESEKILWFEKGVSQVHSTVYSKWIAGLNCVESTSETWTPSMRHFVNIFGYTTRSEYESGANYVFSYHAVMDKNLSNVECCKIIKEIQNTPEGEIANLCQRLLRDGK
jgi:hypothetical protein